MQTLDNSVNAWSPSKVYNCLGGSQDGCEHDYTGKVLYIARKYRNIVCIFLLCANLDLLSSIEKCTNKYAYDEWVVEMKVHRNDEPLQRSYFKPCKTSNENKQQSE